MKNLKPVKAAERFRKLCSAGGGLVEYDGNMSISPAASVVSSTVDVVYRHEVAPWRPRRLPTDR